MSSIERTKSVKVGYMNLLYAINVMVYELDPCSSVFCFYVHHAPDVFIEQQVEVN